MASRKEYEMLFQLNAQLGGNYSSTFKSAQGAITAMQKEIAALSKTQSDITAYEKQQSAIEASKKKLEVLRQQYDNIQKEMDETGKYSSALENRLLAKQQQIDKTASSLSAQTDRLNRMGSALRDAGVDTNDLSGASAKLGTQIDAIKVKQEKAADEANNFGVQAAAAFGAVKAAIAAAGIAVALKEIIEFYNEAVKASMEFESAMTGVAKTTDLSDAELAAMSNEIKNLSEEIPIVTEELAGIGETAGQLGIAKANLMDFSEVMAMLATATTMTAEEGATMLAQFASITQMDPSQYSNLASTIVALGNNFSTTEQKIIDMSQGIAASASLAGMSEADMVALSAAVTSLGIETQAGSTAMSRLIQDLMTAVETGDDLNKFASIANMSADEFATAWGDNAVTALQAFVVGLNDTERNGKSAAVALTELGITESRMKNMILTLAGSGDRLNQTLETSARGWAENAALVKEANLRYGTTQSQLVMMQNAYNNLKITIGDQFNPVLGELYELATDILGSTTDFIEENPELVKAITAFAGVMGLAVSGIAAYVAVAKLVPIVSAAMATALKAVTLAIPGLNVIMAVTAGVGLLTAGIVALSAATKDETDALTASSRTQYEELQTLNAEYKKAKELHGETSNEANSLRYEIDRLTESYEANRQTLEEFVAENDELIESHNKILSGYSESTSAIKDEELGALALIYKLEELSEKTHRTAEEHELMQAIIDSLNESVPDLALNYNEVTDSLNMSADSLEHMVKAQAEQERKVESHRAWIDLYKKERELSEQLAEAEENLLLRREELTAAGYNVNAPLIGWSTDLDDYMDEVERLTTAYGENKDALAVVKAQAEEYAAAQENAADSGQALTSAIFGITSSARELAEAYQEAYDAALVSVQGQYNLWDEAASVVAVSAGTINSNLESQVGYWQQYNENLETLTDRSTEIAGLSEVIASFADGSTDSVNAIAGMASATDSELAAMVETWKTLQAEHETVSQSLATLETDFGASMANLQQEFENTIGDMNLGEEAAESARQTMQGFVDGAMEMLPAIQTAYARIAEAAVAAIDERLDINSPSKVLELRGEYAMSGFIGGVSSMEPEVIKAMANAASAGTRAVDAVSAIPGNAGIMVGATSPVFNINYDFAGASVGSVPELETMLKRRNNDLKQYILEVVDDESRDKARRAFR